MIIAVLKWTLLTVVFIGKDKKQWGKVKGLTHIPRRWKNILTKLPGGISQARKTTMPFTAWKCLNKAEILDDFIQHIYPYISYPT